jgi:hypothetical protein
MHCDAEAQILFASRCRPDSDYIAMGTDVHRIPRIMPGVPGVEAIVVVGERNKQLGPGLLVTLNQLIGFPVEERPLRA